MVSTLSSDQVKGRVARYKPLHWAAASDYLDGPDQWLKLALFPNGCAVWQARLSALEQMEQTVLNDAAVSVMKASILPDSLRILDGHPGFPPLPEIAMSVHYNKGTYAPHVGIFADYLVGELGKRRV